MKHRISGLRWSKGYGSRRQPKFYIGRASRRVRSGSSRLFSRFRTNFKG